MSANEKRSCKKVEKKGRSLDSYFADASCIKVARRHIPTGHIGTVLAMYRTSLCVSPVPHAAAVIFTASQTCLGLSARGRRRSPS
jgi:hypothetical protein